MLKQILSSQFSNFEALPVRCQKNTHYTFLNVRACARAPVCVCVWIVDGWMVEVVVLMLIISVCTRIILEQMNVASVNQACTCISISLCEGRGERVINVRVL